MIEIGRIFWRSSGLTSLLRHDHLDYVHVACEYFQGDSVGKGGRLRSLSRQPVPSLRHQCVSWCSDRTYCVSVWALYLLSYCWTPLKRVWLCPLCPLYALIRSPLSLLFSRINNKQKNPLSAFPYKRDTPVP